jgi:citrate synthase
MELLDSQEAAEFLGVSPSTLYAYVSRGKLESLQDPENARQRCYRRADLERLKRRSDATHGHGAAAASALDWGAPILETAISRIRPTGPAYRGWSLRSLLDSDASFEVVAEHLWREDDPDDEQPELPTPDTDPWGEARREARSLQTQLPALADAPPVEQFRAGLSNAALLDRHQLDAPDPDYHQIARRILWLLVELLPSPEGDQSPDQQGEPSLAEAVATRLLPDGGPTRRALVPAVETALTVIAEHELNASAFAARVVASTGADPYACVTAALSAMAGPRHGRVPNRAAELLEAATGVDELEEWLAERLRDDDALPGFGHQLYPGGDPRFALIVEPLREVVDEHPVLAAADRLEAATDRLDIGPPNAAAALGCLARVGGMPEGSASALFAVGRTAGWMAHILEQYDRDQLLRPRARYGDP